MQVLVPSAVADLLRTLTNAGDFGPPTATVGGHSNLTFHTTVDGSDVVVKSATDPIKRDDLRREVRVLESLADLDPAPIAIPQVVAHGDGDGLTLTVLAAIEGTSGIVAVEARDTPTLVQRAAVLGRSMARLHQTAVTPDPAADSFLSDRYAAIHDLVATLGLGSALVDDMRSALRAPALRRGLAFVHGDAGFHNTLWATTPGGGRLAALLDWEFAGWGNPLTDVAWAWWTMAFRRLDPSVWESFADAYGPTALRSIGAPHDLDALVRAQIISLLVRTPPGSAVRDVWLQRWQDLPTLERAPM